VTGYIKHRLTQAGWAGRPQLEEGIYEKITTYTSGVPRKINIFADRLFLFAYLEELDVIDEAAVDAVIEDMSEELSGSMQPSGAKAAAAIVASGDGLDEALESDLLANLHEADLKRVLYDVSHVLDRVIRRKLKIIHHLDKLIARKKAESQ
jgi:hypothetical protein